VDLVRDVGLLENRLQLLSMLREVSPAVKVHRNDVRDAEVLDDLDSVGTSHRDLEETSVGRGGLGGTEVSDGEDDVPLREPLLPRVEVDRVSGEPDGVRTALEKREEGSEDDGSAPRSGQETDRRRIGVRRRDGRAGRETDVGILAHRIRLDDEADTFTPGEVSARRGSDLELLPLERDLGRLPVLETSDGGPRSEILRSIGRGEDVATVEELAAFVVEVIGMVFVREKDGVDGGELGEGKGRVDGRREGEVWGDGELGTSWAEDRVGEEDDVVDSDESRGGGDVGDGNLGHGVRRRRVLGWMQAAKGEDRSGFSDHPAIKGAAFQSVCRVRAWSALVGDLARCWSSFTFADKRRAVNLAGLVGQDRARVGKSKHVSLEARRVRG
jgi:hypothetical protein